MESTNTAGDAPPRRRWPRRRRAILALVLVSAATAGVFFAARDPRVEETPPPRASAGETETALDFIPDWRPVPGYVGSQACRTCHPEQFGTYLQTAHSRALTEVEPPNEPPDAVFDHAASGRRYRVARRQSRLMHEEILPLDDGTEFVLTSVPLRYRVGSGHVARSYLCDRGGGLFVESPVTWYESTAAWGVTPGFDYPEHQSFSRQILEDCLRCHGGQVQTSSASHMRLNLVENAIGCERCHGPGEAHVTARSAEPTLAAAGDDPIVNPRRLSRKLTEAVCQQCHLQGDIRIDGKRVRATDYRPGQPLEKFATVFRLKREAGMTVVGHVEQLESSACYRQSATMTCITCHDMHAPAPVAALDKIAQYRSACMTCHSGRGCKLTPALREEQAENDCVRCHMPKSDTEVPHVAFTHHRIGIHPLKDESAGADQGDSLIPLSDLSGLDEADRNRSLKLARLQVFLMRGPEFQRSDPGRELGRQIDEWLQGLPSEDVDAETEFARFQFLFARDDRRGAERSAERALARDDILSEEEAAILERLALAEFEEGRFEDALPRFGKLARLRSNGFDWYFLGTCEMKLGRSEAASRALQRARELEPAAAGIYEALAAVYHARQDFEKERRVRDDVARLRSRHPARPH